MIEHPIKHEVIAAPNIGDIFPGTQFRINLLKINYRKSPVGRIGEEGEYVKRIDGAAVICVDKLMQY